MENNIKVCVITQSYYRKDGTTKDCLKQMFNMLENQTYKNFKVFITGDNYQPENEFLEICNEYNGEIYIHNNNHSCRDLNLGDIHNYWSYGGIHAGYHSYIKAKEEGYDIALMLDDDDYYYPTYIKSVVDNFTKFPETGFMITKSEYGGEHLPRTNVVNINYNNYIPLGGDSVRSASVHNINLIGDIVLNLWKSFIDEVTKMNSENMKWKLHPADMILLNIIGDKVNGGVYKSLYIPVALVKKTSDRNWHNIMTTRSKLFNIQKSGESLKMLRDVNLKIKERKFHEFTYILYDIRTFLGDEEKTFLEIGSYVGSSSSLMLQHKYNTNLICIDPCVLHPSHYNGSLSQLDTLQKNISNNNIHDYKVEIFKQYSIDLPLLNKLKMNNTKIDILFIDGDHSYKGVLNDWNNFKDFVNPGGFICFDDIYSPEVRPAVDYIVQHLDTNKYEIIGSLENIHKLMCDNLAVYKHPGYINEFIIYKK